MTAIYTAGPSTVGRRSSRTPEGFLLCQGVAIARTGLQIYGPEEIPVIPPGPDGFIRVERMPEDVFRPETIASFEGKSVVNEHPDDDVLPATYKELTCGTVMNVRRGDGIDDDLLLADLLVMDADAIRDVEGGKREVSCGYDAQYEVLGPGHGRQHTIVGNHVALVQSARCGARCRIVDHARRVRVHDDARCGAREPRGGRVMSKFRDLMRRAYRAKDEGQLTELEKEAEEMEPSSQGGGDSVHVHLHGARGTTDDDDEPDDQLIERLAAMERELEEVKATNAEMLSGHEQLEDLLDEITDEPEPEAREDARDRYRDRSRGRDSRRGRDRMRDRVRRHMDRARRAHDAVPEDEREVDWKAKDVKMRGMARDVDREDCTYDEMRQHDRALRDMRRTRDDEPPDAGNRAIEGDLEMEAPQGTGDRARKARDSALLEDSWQETVAMSEVIAPGQTFPTFDRAAKPGQTLDAIGKLRRRTLDAAHAADPLVRADLDHAVGGDYAARVRTLDRASLRMLFRTLAGAQRARNNAVPTADSAMMRTVGGVKTPADLQKLHDEFWAKQRVA